MDFPYDLGDINSCIYCGTRSGNLSKEQVVPYGLNGMHTLSRASCENCAKITSSIEFTVLRTTFISARKYLNLNSRRKKQDWKNPEEEFVTLIFPITDQPAYITKREYVSGVTVKGMTIHGLAGPPTGPSKVTFKGNDFERMLAKIAYGFAVSKYGLDGFKVVYVLPAILGLVDDIGKWVGTAEDEIILYNATATYEFLLWEFQNDVYCRIKLFSMFDVPEYLVVVGALTNAVASTN